MCMGSGPHFEQRIHDWSEAVDSFDHRVIAKQDRASNGSPCVSKKMQDSSTRTLLGYPPCYSIV